MQGGEQKGNKLPKNILGCGIILMCSQVIKTGEKTIMLLSNLPLMALLFLSASLQFDKICACVWPKVHH